MSLRLSSSTYAALDQTASSLGLSANSLASDAIETWLSEVAPERLAAVQAEADAKADAASKAADLIRQLSGEDTTP